MASAAGSSVASGAASVGVGGGGSVATASVVAGGSVGGGGSVATPAPVAVDTASTVTAASAVASRVGGGLGKLSAIGVAEGPSGALPSS